MGSRKDRGEKLAGAYISEEKDEALAILAEEKGFSNKADFLRWLINQAIDDVAAPPAGPAPLATALQLSFEQWDELKRRTISSGFSSEMDCLLSHIQEWLDNPQVAMKGS